MSPADRVVQAWFALDQLTNYKIPEQGITADGETQPVHDVYPWELLEPVKGKQLIGRVYVDSFPAALMERRLVALLGNEERYRAENPRRRKPPPQPQVCRAYFDLDAEGVPIAGSLGYCPLPDLVATLHDGAGGQTPLDDVLQQALGEVAGREIELSSIFDETLGWVTEDDVSSREKVLGIVYRLSRDPNEPWPWLAEESADQVPLRAWCTSRWIDEGEEPGLFKPQSFFRNDLQRVMESDRSPLLERYLEVEPSDRAPDALDVHRDEVLASLIDPRGLPRAAWPASFRALLDQQVAVRVALTDPGLVAVNGPPGTGKTTALRDVYANVVTQRAARMVEFDDPRTAFTARGDDYEIDDRLTGFEMLLVSSNNLAVENITREIPQCTSLGEAHRSLDYFREAMAWVPPAKGPRKIAVPPLDNGQPCWGLAAAVLGNKENLDTFLTGAGFFTSFEDKRSNGSLMKRLSSARPQPTVWRDTRARYREAARRVEALVQQKQGQADVLAAIAAVEQDIATLQREAQTHTAQLATATERVRVSGRKRDSARAARKRAGDAVREHQSQKPSLGQWLFRSEMRRTWKTQRDALGDKFKARNDKLQTARSDFAHAKTTEQEAASRLRACEQKLDERHQEWQRQCEALGPCGPETVDPTWWARSYAERKLSTAWTNEEFHTAQVELFEAALAVHEAFLNECGTIIAKLLRNWRWIVKPKPGQVDSSNRVLHAWQALFLVVPLVSSTFASVGRLLRDLGSESLGYVIVDEAGQANAHHAVGAFWRARRICVVGDPDQLEPVNVVPDALLRAVMRTYGASDTKSPVDCSVQTLADSAARYGTTRNGRWIGLPLTVHQRCLDPMFPIARDMVYPDMIQGRGPDRPAKDGVELLRPSQWIDVAPPAKGKWNPSWASTLGALLDEIEATAGTASVAVLTPFREVKDAITPLVARRPNVNAGTIHTFQGKEANVGILVLGAGPETKKAVSWATEKPNLLNVAVTRAKDRLYVIGHAETWRDEPNAHVVWEHLGRSSE